MSTCPQSAVGGGGACGALPLCVKLLATQILEEKSLYSIVYPLVSPPDSSGQCHTHGHRQPCSNSAHSQSTKGIGGERDPERRKEIDRNETRMR